MLTDTHWQADIQIDRHVRKIASFCPLLFGAYKTHIRQQISEQQNCVPHTSLWRKTDRHTTSLILPIRSPPTDRQTRKQPNSVHPPTFHRLGQPFVSGTLLSFFTQSIQGMAGTARPGCVFVYAVNLPVVIVIRTLKELSLAWYKHASCLNKPSACLSALMWLAVWRGIPRHACYEKYGYIKDCYVS